MLKKAKEVAVKWLESKDAGRIHRIAYNTSLGGAERSQQREIVIKQNQPVGLGTFEKESIGMRKLKYTRIDTSNHLPNKVSYT